MSDVRYIGKARDPVKRYASHYDAPTKHLPVTRWIDKRDAAGEHVWQVVLEWVPAERWEEAERAYIALGRQLGWRLLNIAPGGMGARNAVMSNATRKARGYFQSDAWRAIAAAGGRTRAGTTRDTAATWGTCECGLIGYASKLRRGHCRTRGHQVVATWCWAAPELRRIVRTCDAPAGTMWADDRR